MPINFYGGLMGSGKSYEVVSTPLLEALGKNRRNVKAYLSGLDIPAIREYAAKKYNIPLADVGQLEIIKEADINAANFYPVEGEDANKYFIKPGDLVIIDEARRFYSKDNKIAEAHSIFFREHRHIVDPETKVSCDIILISQDIMDIHRTIKSVIELSFKTTKLKSLGLNRSYRLEMFDGGSFRAASRTDIFVKKYSAEIFPLYSSYQGGVGKEVAVDSRQNVLKNPKLWFTAVLVLVMGFGGIYYLVHFFTGKKTPPATATSSQIPQGIAPPNGTYPRPVAASLPATPAYRLVGVYSTGGRRYALVQSSDGLLRYITVSADSVLDGVRSAITVDGKNTATFSGIGAQPAEQQKGGLFK